MRNERIYKNASVIDYLGDHSAQFILNLKAAELILPFMYLSEYINPPLISQDMNSLIQFTSKGILNLANL